MRSFEPSLDTVPVKLGDKIQEKIISRGQDREGDAVVKVKGYVVFVKTDKDIGEEVRAEIIRILPRYGFANEV